MSVIWGQRGEENRCTGKLIFLHGMNERNLKMPWGLKYLCFVEYEITKVQIIDNCFLFLVCETDIPRFPSAKAIYQDDTNKHTVKPVASLGSIGLRYVSAAGFFIKVEVRVRCIPGFEFRVVVLLDWLLNFVCIYIRVIQRFLK